MHSFASCILQAKQCFCISPGPTFLPGPEGRAALLTAKYKDAYAIAQAHGVRLTFSGLSELALQPTLVDINNNTLIVINSIFQSFVPDIMHVFTGGVWKRILDWIMEGVFCPLRSQKA